MARTPFRRQQGLIMTRVADDLIEQSLLAAELAIAANGWDASPQLLALRTLDPANHSLRNHDVVAARDIVPSAVLAEYGVDNVLTVLANMPEDDNDGEFLRRIRRAVVPEGQLLCVVLIGEVWIRTGPLPAPGTSIADLPPDEEGNATREARHVFAAHANGTSFLLRVRNENPRFCHPGDVHMGDVFGHLTMLFTKLSV